MNDLISKPSRRYIAHAIPYDGGWLAQYSFPGAVPQFVRWAFNGESAIYDSADDAESAAAFALINALNHRPRERTTRERYRLMSGDDLTEAIGACSMTPRFASYLLGVPLGRWFQWVDEERDRQGNAMAAPHMARLLLELWRQFPETVEACKAVTDSVTSERKPRKEAAE